MKKAFKKITAIILTAITLIGICPVISQAAPSKAYTDSTYTTTFTVTTKSSWTEFAKEYPATLTFTQTKGDCVFINKYGNVERTVKNVYCQYDVDYKIYRDGKYYGSGHTDFYGASMKMKLKASCNKTFKYVFTVKPRYARVYNSLTKSYYLGYKWTKASKVTIDPTHDIVSLTKNSATKNK